MAYPKEYRQLALDKIAQGKSIRTVAKELNVSTRTIQNWKESPVRKIRTFTPYKIQNDALKHDVEMYPDAYQYERAMRLKCSKSGISSALKRLGITQKKDSQSP